MDPSRLIAHFLNKVRMLDQVCTPIKSSPSRCQKNAVTFFNNKEICCKIKITKYLLKGGS